MDTYLLKFENWMTLKNYAKKTHKSYLCSVRQFWGFCEGQAGKEGFSKDNAVDFFCCTASMSSRSVGKRSTAIIRRCAYFMYIFWIENGICASCPDHVNKIR
jgi:hypothetical protein